MACLFLEIPENPGFMYKYTCRSKDPEVVDIAGAPSLAREVMKFGKSAVVNRCECSAVLCGCGVVLCECVNVLCYVVLL